jgi:signal transduction histidine kinase
MPQMFGNLSIRPKLVTLLAVPVAGTALLAAAGAAAELGERAEAQRERRVAAVAELAVAAAHQLQEERARALAWTGGRGRAGERALAARRARVDWSLAAYRTGAAGLRGGDPALDQAAAAAAGRLGRLAVVRAEVDRRLATGDRVTAELDTMVAALLEVARELTDRLDAPGPARAGRLLLAMARAKEATGRERNLLAAPAPPPPGATAAGARAEDDDRPAATGAGAGPEDDDRSAATAAGAGDDARRGAAGEALAVRLGAVAAVARHELNGVRAAAGDRLDGIDRALAAPGVRRLRRLELGLLQPPAGPPALGDLDGWRAGTADRAGALRRVERQAAADLDAAARAELRLRDGRLRGRLALLGAAALATLAALAALGGLAGRRARPPAPATATVPGLARRGQALADRQLQLLEELAADEPDPRRRQALLGVDHLAARLRRTAETLLAMTGPPPARRRARPVPLAVVLRAAVAESVPQGPEPPRPGRGGPGAPPWAAGAGAPVGRGRRVDLLATGEVEVAGPASVDLAHLLAELLDNAAACSPPTAPVVVTAAADGDDHVIEVADRGLGMTAQELAWANQRLAGGTAADPAHRAAGDRLGLLVVAHLAARNGVGVRLAASPGGGVTATVRLPAALLTARTPAPARPS